MREKKISRIKQYRIWICLLAKRLWRQPAYICLLALIPVLGYAVGIMERGERSGVAAAVCVENGSWSDEIRNLLAGQERDSVLQFVFCDGRDEVERRVAAGEADCGFVIGSDLEERVLGGDWRKSIAAYETDSSSITGIAKERLAGVIFRLYSEECYRKYMRQVSETATDFAIAAYENHMADDSTFGFRYLYDDPDSQVGTDTSVGNDNAVNAAVFPIKGVLAVLIFAGGMCGMLEYEKDKNEKRFVRIAPNILTYMVNVWMAEVFIAMAALICMWLSDGIRACGDNISTDKILSVWSAGMWGKQIIHLLFYLCVIVVYCVVIRVLLHRQETIAAAIPILTLGSLVCAPVFIRLGTYLPVFTVLEKLFPVSYYLMLS